MLSSKSLPCRTGLPGSHNHLVPAHASQPLGHSPHPGRASTTTVHMGRNDGASNYRPSAPTRRWYPDTAPGEASTSGSGNQDSGAGGSSSSRGGQQQRGARRGRRAIEDDEEEGDGLGWWQKPEERSLEAYAMKPLLPWQIAKLETAYVQGRRKVQIQELARDTDLDRNVVTAWFKEFATRPAEERDAIMIQRKAEIEVARGQAEEQRLREASRQLADSIAPPAARPMGTGEQGFIPFYVRKDSGMEKQKRIPGTALRTLESIYDRTPYPSKDIIQGLFELHRISNETATEWFRARRAADGITSSTQKRVNKSGTRERDAAALQDAFTDARKVRTGSAEDRADPKNQKFKGRADLDPEESGADLVQMMGEMAPKKAKGSGEAAPTVVSVSKREMAMLRSSLPSPRKYKGQKLAADMGVKSAPDQDTTQIGNLQYVQDSKQEEAKIANAWRNRQLTRDSSSLRVRLKRAPAPAGSEDDAA